METMYTSRYGGRLPSWLRACHGMCEAMGVYPVKGHDPDGSAMLHLAGQPLTSDEALAVERRIAAGQRESDGWYFIPCPDCHGTGRVSWAVTVLRIPRWIWKGLAFLRWGLRNDVHPPTWSFWKRFRVTLYACWGADIIGLWN